MAICTTCGAASALGARLCAACGQPFPELGRARPDAAGGAPAIGAVDDVTAPAAGHGRWGGGVPYEPRGAGIGRALTGWVPALRALLAPTLLLLCAAVLPALPEDGLWPPGTGSGDRFRGSVALVLTVFGSPLDLRSAGDADGLGLVSGVELRLVPVLLTAAWLALLWWGLRSGRRRAAAVGGALAEAARTAAVSGAAALLLGWFGRVDLLASVARPQMGHLAVRADLPVAAPVAAVLAGALALAVHGADAIRARAPRWSAVAPPAARSALLAVVPAVVAAPLVAAGCLPDAPPAWAWLPLAANGGLLLLGLGSGATVHLDGGDAVRSVSLFHLGGADGQWCWALLPALAGALALGALAHRRRFDTGDRVRLGLAYAALLGVPTVAAGLSMRYRIGLGVGPGRGYEHVYALAPSIGTVLVAELLWAAFGALALPALFDAVRPSPVGRHAPHPAPDAPPVDAVHAVEEPPLPPLPHRAEVLDWRARG